MPYQKCAVCHKEDSTSNLKYCSRCDLWVHFACAGGSVGILLSSNAYCPSCGKKLELY